MLIKGNSGSDNYKIKVNLIVVMTKDIGELECPIGFYQAENQREEIGEQAS